MKTNIKPIQAALLRLESAISGGCSVQYCLMLWSRFIRTRDANRCVLCHKKGRLSAHHITRKSFMEEARFQTGNGISLCHICHKDPHIGFNRRPNLNLPMDEEGGEKTDLMTSLYWKLLSDARKRNILCDDYYYLSDQLLQKFKLFQSIDPFLQFSGSRLEQAYLIWRQTPRATLRAVLSANGIELPKDFIQYGELTLFCSTQNVQSTQS